MNGMRKVVFFFTAMVLAAFALPAAAQKVYTLNLAPTSLNAGASGVALICSPIKKGRYFVLNVGSIEVST